MGLARLVFKAELESRWFSPHIRPEEKRKLTQFNPTQLAGSLVGLRKSQFPYHRQN